jgi:hypothetical protein
MVRHPKQGRGRVHMARGKGGQQHKPSELGEWSGQARTGGSAV